MSCKLLVCTVYFELFTVICFVFIVIGQSPDGTQMQLVFKENALRDFFKQISHLQHPAKDKTNSNTESSSNKLVLERENVRSELDWDTKLSEEMKTFAKNITEEVKKLFDESLREINFKKSILENENSRKRNYIKAQFDIRSGMKNNKHDPSYLNNMRSQLYKKLLSNNKNILPIHREITEESPTNLDFKSNSYPYKYSELKMEPEHYEQFTDKFHNYERHLYKSLVNKDQISGNMNERRINLLVEQRQLADKITENLNEAMRKNRIKKKSFGSEVGKLSSEDRDLVRSYQTIYDLGNDKMTSSEYDRKPIEDDRSDRLNTEQNMDERKKENVIQPVNYADVYKVLHSSDFLKNSLQSHPDIMRMVSENKDLTFEVVPDVNSFGFTGNSNFGKPVQVNFTSV